jgi:hypothetical protein
VDPLPIHRASPLPHDLQSGARGIFPSSVAALLHNARSPRPISPTDREFKRTKAHGSGVLQDKQFIVKKLKKRKKQQRKGIGHVETTPSKLRMAGLGNNPVQVFATGRANHWEFLRLRTGFELSSSWNERPPLLWNKSESKYFRFMRWPQIDLGAQDLNDIQRPTYFSKNSWK